MIDDLIDLVNVVTRQKVKQIEILTEATEMSSKSKLLLDGLREGRIRSDGEAKKILYPDGINSGSYNKLKTRLYNRLLNTLFFIDVKKSKKGKIGVKRDDAYKLYCQIMIINSEGRKRLAVKMATRLYDRIYKDELFDINLLLANFLNEYYSVWSPNKKLAEKYEIRIGHAINSLKEIKSVTPIWSELAKSLMNYRSSRLTKHQLSLYKTKLDKIRELRTKNSGNLFLFRLYAAENFFLWISQRFEEQRELCNRTIESLKNRPIYIPLHHLLFRNYKGVAELNLGLYTDAEQTLNSILIDFPLTPGKVHWFNIYNYLFLTKMINRKYVDASNLLWEVVQLRNFSKTDKKWKEPWLIKEAYINLLIKIDKIDEVNLKGNKLRKFRFSKFVNEVPLYFKDKRGLNVSILIAQFIYLLVENKTNEMHDRLDGLKQYSYRYLRNDSTFRSNCFIKMLLKIPGAGFHPLRVENHTKELKKKLLATPMMISEQSYEVEIIPYEDLWEIVMEILYKRINKKG